MKTLAAVLLGLGLSVGSATGQALPIKKPEPLQPGECPTVPDAVSTHGASSVLLDSLLSAGSRAAILGDHESAEELLRRAAALDPHNPVVSYRLARTLDERGHDAPAALEYCRYLALAPAAPDAEEIRARARGLLLSGGSSYREPWRIEADAGVAAFEAGRYEESAEAFTRVLELLPELPEAYYNRGVALLSAGLLEEAAVDLEAYLRMIPDADDAVPVRGQLERARASAVRVAEAPPLARRAAPGSVLLQGLVMPGLGQHATGRTFWGIGVLAAVGSAVYFATREDVVVRRVEAEDPFGNRYEYDRRTLERPHQAIGLGAAVAIGLGAAIEGYLYARRQPRADASVASSVPAGSRRSLTFSLAPSGDAVRVGVRIHGSPPRSRGTVDRWSGVSGDP